MSSDPRGALQHARPANRPKRTKPHISRHPIRLGVTLLLVAENSWWVPRMNRKFPRYAIAVCITLVVLAGLFAAGAASANPLFTHLLGVVPDPTPTLLLGAGLAGLAFQGRPKYHEQ